MCLKPLLLHFSTRAKGVPDCGNITQGEAPQAERSVSAMLIAEPVRAASGVLAGTVPQARRFFVHIYSELGIVRRTGTVWKAVGSIRG